MKGIVWYLVHFMNEAELGPFRDYLEKNCKVAQREKAVSTYDQICSLREEIPAHISEGKVMVLTDRIRDWFTRKWQTSSRAAEKSRTNLADQVISHIAKHAKEYRRCYLVPMGFSPFEVRLIEECKRRGKQEEVPGIYVGCLKAFKKQKQVDADLFLHISLLYEEYQTSDHNLESTNTGAIIWGVLYYFELNLLFRLVGYHVNCARLISLGYLPEERYFPQMELFVKDALHLLGTVFKSGNRFLKATSKLSKEYMDTAKEVLSTLIQLSETLKRKGFPSKEELFDIYESFKEKVTPEFQDQLEQSLNGIPSFCKSPAIYKSVSTMPKNGGNKPRSLEELRLAISYVENKPHRDRHFYKEMLELIQLTQLNASQITEEELIELEIQEHFTEGVYLALSAGYHELLKSHSLSLIKGEKERKKYRHPASFENLISHLCADQHKNLPIIHLRSPVSSNAILDLYENFFLTKSKGIGYYSPESSRNLLRQFNAVFSFLLPEDAKFVYMLLLGFTIPQLNQTSETDSELAFKLYEQVHQFGEEQSFFIQNGRLIGHYFILHLRVLIRNQRFSKAEDYFNKHIDKMQHSGAIESVIKLFRAYFDTWNYKHENDYSYLENVYSRNKQFFDMYMAVSIRIDLLGGEETGEIERKISNFRAALGQRPDFGNEAESARRLFLNSVMLLIKTPREGLSAILKTPQALKDDWLREFTTRVISGEIDWKY
ncbi:MAG: hypothetical protein AAGI38_23260 [Bacteroidota bacterium]